MSAWLQLPICKTRSPLLATSTDSVITKKPPPLVAIFVNTPPQIASTSTLDMVDMHVRADLLLRQRLRSFFPEYYLITI